MHLAITSTCFVSVYSTLAILHLTSASVRNRSGKLGRGISPRQIYPNFVVPPEVQRDIASRMFGFNDKDVYLNLPQGKSSSKFGSSSTVVMAGPSLRLKNNVKTSRTVLNSSNTEWEDQISGYSVNGPGSRNFRMRNSSSSGREDEEDNAVKVNPWMIILCSGVFIVCVSVSLYLFGLRRQRMRGDEELL